MGDQAFVFPLGEEVAERIPETQRHSQRLLHCLIFFEGKETPFSNEYLQFGLGHLRVHDMFAVCAKDPSLQPIWHIFDQHWT